MTFPVFRREIAWNGLCLYEFHISHW